MSNAKFEFAVRTLVAACQSIATCEVNFTSESIQKDDPATYDFLCSGKMPNAIPYFSDEVTGVLDQLQPQNDEHLQMAFKQVETDFEWLLYKLAWLHVHYPTHLRAGALTAAYGNSDTMQDEVWNCIETGISVHAPNINKSETFCVPKGKGSIRMGFGAIAGIGNDIAEHIVAARARYKTELEPKERDRPWVFMTFEEFLHAIDLNLVQADDIKRLIRAGVFQYILTNPRAAYEAIDRMVTEIRACGEISTPANDILSLTMWNPKQILANEFELLGAYVSTHPLRPHIPWFADNIAKIKATAVTEVSCHTLLVRVVSVDAHHILSQSKNRYAATVKLDDPFGRLMVYVQSDNYSECLVPNNFLLVHLIARTDDNKSGLKYALLDAAIFTKQLPEGLSKGDFNFHHIRYLSEKQYAESVLSKAVESIETMDCSDAIHISPPMDDQDVNEFLWHCSGNPFELCDVESNDIIRKARPDNLAELLNAIVLGTEFFIEAGVTDAYLECMQGKAMPSYLIPELKHLLESTYGFMLFREQFYSIVETLAGYSNDEAKNFHRVLTRKAIDELLHARKSFMGAVTGSIMTEDEASSLFDWLEKWACCVRSREHLIEPATLCYRLACVKLHYPDFFNIATEIVKRKTAI